MTPDERADIAVRLVAMQGTLRTLMDSAREQAQVYKEADASGLAFAVLMLEEAIRGYSQALTAYVSGLLEEDPLDTN